MSQTRNDKTTNDDRRREARISGDGARFLLRRGKDGVLCKVINLSRLGLGIELPIQNSDTLYQELKPEEHVSGVLHVGKKHIDAEAIVRVRRGEFLGLEYEMKTPEFMSELRALLSPKYIAASIQKISPEYLSQDISLAYRGDEFECLMFKTGLGNAKEAIQIFAGGRFVEIVDGAARFVPAPLIRTTGGEDALDFVLQFASLDDSQDKKELRKFFHQVESILAVWQEAPDSIVNLVSEQLIALK